jgi:hypothetical protein
MTSGAGWGSDWIVPRQRIVEEARSLARRLAGWARRHPRAVLIGLAVFVVLAPLLRDLFFTIPWPVRKGMGWVVFGAVLALSAARIGLVRTSDDPEPTEPEPARGLDRIWPWALAVACGWLAWPMLRHPENLGFGDWDLFLGKGEAARRTIALYGQFPWWDPWTRGGFPLAANPQCGVSGVAMPLMLLFGTVPGMGLGTIVCFLLAAEGARRLARLWLGDPLASFAVGLIYAINGAMLVAAVAAYHVSMCYPALPWMLYHIVRLDRGPWNGVGLGFWAAFNVLNGIQYFTVYIVLIAGVAWLRALRVRTGERRRLLVVHTLLALGLFLALAGWRIATTGLVYRDFPRPHATGMDESLAMVVRYLLYRRSAAYLAATEIPHFWETNCYIGPVVLALGLASLAWGWRWWHTLTGICVLLGVGSLHWYHPSYWLSHLPLFTTMHVVTRWRFMALLGVALAVGGVLAAWRRSPNRWVRGLAPLLTGVIAADYVSYGFEVLPVAFSVRPDEALFPGPPLPPGDFEQVQINLMLPSILRGYGVVQGYESMISYQRGTPTLRRWRGHPEYRGEHWTADGPVEPALWSPNRIEFQVRPNQEVFINQNPGSWWWINGRPAYPDRRCAEPEEMLSGRADANGRLVLEIRPRGLELGLALHGIGAALAIASWIGSRRLRAAARSAAEAPG